MAAYTKNEDGKIAKNGEPLAAPAEASAPKPITLSQAEMAAIRSQAAEQVRAEERKALMDTALKAEIEKLRREMGLEPAGPGDMVDFFVDVAGCADRITLDGTMYMHGQRVHLPRRVYDTMREIMARTHDHEEQCNNPYRKFYQRLPGPENTMNQMARQEDLVRQKLARDPGDPMTTHVGSGGIVANHPRSA